MYDDVEDDDMMMYLADVDREMRLAAWDARMAEKAIWCGVCGSDHSYYDGCGA